MSSLWGSKKTDDHTDNTDEQNGGENGTGRPHTARQRDFDADESRMREPTERDRLLPDNNRRPPHSDGYLDPDDPAVRRIPPISIHENMSWSEYICSAC